MSNSSIWPISWTLPGTTTPVQSRPGNDDDEEVLRIIQSSSFTEALQPDCLESHTGHTFREPYPPAEIQLVYSAALVDWVRMLGDI